MYNLDLLFRGDYIIKPVNLDSQDLIMRTINKIKQLLYNKNTKINLDFKSSLNFISIDEDIFLYLIHDLIVKTHQNSTDQI